jgi:phospholipid/cholesterol/gamma-HCH transport system substrate-binding protein
METRANYVLIGVFTLAVIFGAFGFVYWFHHVGGIGVRNYYRVVFEGAIGGLRVGAPVSFNGIRVGEVTDLFLDPNDPKQSLATISVDGRTPMRSDTQVSLEFQGLTGIASLTLRGGSPDAKMVSIKEGELPTLIARSNASQDVMQAARDALAHVDKVITDNEATLKASLKNIEMFTESLAKNSGKIDRILAGADNLLGGPDGKGELPEMIKSIKTTSDNLDKRLDLLVRDGRSMLATVSQTFKNLDANPSRLLFGGRAATPAADATASAPAAAPRRPQSTVRTTQQ